MNTKNTSGSPPRAPNDASWLVWIAGAGCLAAATVAGGGCELIASVDPDLLNEGGGGSTGTTSTVTSVGSGSTSTTTTGSPTSSSSSGDGGQGGTGGTGGTGGDGGGGGTGGADICDDPAEDCPEAAECQTAICADDVCDTTNANEGSACDLGGGEDGVCSDNGECIQCLTIAECPEPAECQVALCSAAGVCGTEDAEDGVDCVGGTTCLDGVCQIPEDCDNDELDPGETDIDCGGGDVTDCPLCVVDDSCLVAGDCLTGFCDLTTVGGPTCQLCDGNDDCPAAQWCDLDAGGGTCTDDKDTGACDDDAECTGNVNCVDNFCCESACNGPCEACNATGACDPAEAGTADDACEGPECLTGLCDDSRACEPEGTAVTCGTPASCTAGVETVQDTCGTDTGLCEDAGTNNCTPYVCGATACRTSCSMNSHCASGNYCNVNVCEPVLDPGETCDEATDCGSNFCVDDVCCNSLCNGTCERCDIATLEGTCSPEPSGDDPDMDCTADDQTNACLTGACDGARACAVKADGNPGTPTCTGFIFCDGAPGGACPAECLGDGDCPGGRWCDAAGDPDTCVGDLPAGDPCTRPAQCVSNSCGVATAGQCDP